MRVLLAMTYFRPYVSGPIIYAENLARELRRRGHEVTILTARYEPGLAAEEVVDGVRVVRVPVAGRVSKGVVMPTYPRAAWRALREHEVVAIQVPQFEAPLLAALARVLARPAVMTYHCDVQLPSGWFNRVADRIILAGNVITARLVPTVVAYTRDYAEHSPVMGRVLDKVTVVPPPVEMAPPSEEAVAAFRARFDLGDGPVVGIAARFATEKGFEHLVGALPTLVAEFPDLRVVHAGEFEHVIGEQGYRDRLRPTLQRFAAHWRTAGVLGGGDLAAFFATCDVTVLPSLNRTESFGFVQIESMLNGTPVVASALPGVRVPTTETGMGLTVPPGDPTALATAVATVLRQPERYRMARADVEARYSPARTADGYEEVFAALVDERRDVEAARAILRPQLRDLPAFRAMIRAMEARLVQALGPLPHPLLDVGTGDGHFAATVLGPVDVGVDPDAASLAEAAARGVYRSLLQADATRLPFDDGSFAAVVSNCVLEHIPDLDGVLAEIARVLRPGGRFVTTVPLRRLNDELGITRALERAGAGTAADRYRTAFARIQRHHHMYEPEGWRARLEAAGLAVDASVGYMSARAARRFDLMHATGVPNLVWRRLTGRWVPSPLASRLVIKERLLAPLVAEHDPPDATGLFLVAHRR